MLVRKSNLLPDFFNDFLDNNWLSDTFNESKNVPAVNISETGDSYKIDVAAPGLAKEDFNIGIDGKILTVSCEKEQKTEENDEKYMRREFSYSSFSRSFTLPECADEDKINAVHQNGVLQITVPKKEEEKEKTKRIIDIS